MHDDANGARLAVGYAEHVGKLADGHLNADAGQEAEQDGPGQEVRQEAEPGQPRHQQHAAGEEGSQAR